MELVRWLQHPEDGVNCTETCRANNGIKTYVKLTCSCWKLKIYCILAKRNLWLISDVIYMPLAKPGSDYKPRQRYF